MATVTCFYASMRLCVRLFLTREIVQNFMGIIFIKDKPNFKKQQIRALSNLVHISALIFVDLFMCFFCHLQICNPFWQKFLDSLMHNESENKQHFPYGFSFLTYRFSSFPNPPVSQETPESPSREKNNSYPVLASNSALSSYTTVSLIPA